MLKKTQLRAAAKSGSRRTGYYSYNVHTTSIMIIRIQKVSVDCFNDVLRSALLDQRWQRMHAHATAASTHSTVTHTLTLNCQVAQQRSGAAIEL